MHLSSHIKERAALCVLHSLGLASLLLLGCAEEHGGGAVMVPSLRGSSYADAESVVKNAGLKPRLDPEHRDHDCDISRQDPPAGAEVPRGSEVRISLSC